MIMMIGKMIQPSSHRKKFWEKYFKENYWQEQKQGGENLIFFSTISAGACGTKGGWEEAAGSWYLLGEWYEKALQGPVHGPKRLSLLF
jgi:hypothetical protein